MARTCFEDSVATETEAGAAQLPDNAAGPEHPAGEVDRAGSAESIRFAAILDGIGDCFYAVDNDWDLTFLNRTAERHFGLARRDVLGRNLWEVFPGADKTALGRRIRALMGIGEPVVFEAESIAVPDRHVEFRVFPLGDGLGVSFRDVTERWRHERLLHENAEHLGAIFGQATAGLAETDLEGRFLRVNDRFCAIVGRSNDELLRLTMQEVTHPDDLPRNVPLFQRLVETGEAFEIEKRYLRPDGSMVWVGNSVSALRDPAGTPVAIIAVTIDITARKRADERQRLLINELNHRVKNTLATVQSIAAQSFRDTAREAQRSFESRLIALSRAHDVLTRETWSGAELHRIVEEVLEPLERPGAPRFSVSGPKLLLLPQTALALAMALHELATNATKYGALSSESGGVAISWSVSDEPPRLLLRWREQGGPPVTAPSRRGFGSRLIEQGLPRELDGAVRLTYAPDGLRCEIEAPLAPLDGAALRR